MAEPELTDGELEGRANEDAAPNPLLEISNEMVRIYKEQFGRGPTKVRTNYAGPDTLVCLLEHTFTPAERNLQAMGEHQRLRDIRMLFQYAETSRFTEPIERITGRRVRGFISGIDTNHDIASEMFILDPIQGPHEVPRHQP
ncbi:MAG: hypothetical protein QOD66_3264 [Solirubrobacteraceae bacterium]|jgi:uncharacterized protein YbcI|nr:hypothetical protein [Solirubrobacteraceae bacterium]